MVSTLSEAKTYGGIGSILVLFTAIPTIGWLLGIVGFIFIIMAVKYISDAFADKSIYNNMLVSILLDVAAIAVGTLAIYGTVLRVMGLGSFVGSNFVLNSNIAVGDWVGLAAGVIAGLVAVWALLVTSAVFLRRSYDSMASKLGVNTFKTAGLVFLIGAATTIIGVGFVLILVAQILLVVAFFSIKEGIPVPTQQQPVATIR
ncbi:MAG: DUF996 domain-containing protein [Candidatus Bathyarchaeia archaeon]